MTLQLERKIKVILYNNDGILQNLQHRGRKNEYCPFQPEYAALDNEPRLLKKNN